MEKNNKSLPNELKCMFPCWTKYVRKCGDIDTLGVVFVNVFDAAKKTCDINLRNVE
jgi:hypothetical protein